MNNLKEILTECVNLYKANHSFRMNWPQFNYEEYIKIGFNNGLLNFTISDLCSFVFDHELIHYDIAKNAEIDLEHRTNTYNFLSEVIVNYKQYIDYGKKNKFKFDILKCRIFNLIDTIEYINKRNGLYDNVENPKPIIKGINLYPEHPEYSNEDIINFYGGLAGCQIAYDKLKNVWNNEELNNFENSNSIIAKYLKGLSSYILNAINNYKEINNKLIDAICCYNANFVQKYNLKVYEDLPTKKSKL